MYEIDVKKVIKAVAVLVAVIAVIIVICAVSCTGKQSITNWNGEWNREGDATYSRSELTIYDTDNSGFYFDISVYNGNRAGHAENLRAEFRGDRQTATYEIKDTDAYIEFVMDEEGSLMVEFFSVSSVESDVIEGFGYGAYLSGIYAKGEVEYLFSSLSEMEVLPEERDNILRKAIDEAQYLRLLDCFQTHSTARSDIVAADIYYGMVTGDDYAAILLFYDDNSFSMIISADGDYNMTYITNNNLYTADLGAYPEPIQEWLEDFETAYYAKLNEAE